MRSAAIVLSVALLSTLSSFARADTVFDFSGYLETGRDGDTTGNYDHGNPLNGTVTLGDNGVFTAVNLSYDYNVRDDAHPFIVTLSFSGSHSGLQGDNTTLTLDGVGTKSGLGGSVLLKMLSVPTEELLTSNSITLCSSYSCSGYATASLGREVYTGGAVLDYATITRQTPLPTSVSPEPSSFLLLGTGLLGTVATLRRRRAV